MRRPVLVKADNIPFDFERTVIRKYLLRLVIAVNRECLVVAVNRECFSHLRIAVCREPFVR